MKSNGYDGPDTSTVSVTFHNTFIKKEGEEPSLGS